MTAGLRTVTIEELCHTLGLRTPIGLVPADRDLQAPSAEVAAVTDEQLTALSVLAQPEAIAVVTVWPRPHPFAPSIPVVHVIATRGPWVAEHVIEGDAHHLHAADADGAAVVLVERAGLTDDSPAPRHGAVDITLGAYLRMTELVRAGDIRRAEAALIGDGADAEGAAALVRAALVGGREIAGLGSDGRRFVGCDLAFVGDATTGRWLVPTTHHVDPLPRNALRHPALAGAGHLRVLVEPVGPGALREELGPVFGQA